MPTINDVAKKAGVSRSTVSLVINKSPLVKEETRRAVERVIEEIHYVPNSNARGLSAQVTNNLGLVYMQDYFPDNTDIAYHNDQPIGLCSLNISNGIMAGLSGTNYGVITERFCSIGMPGELPRIVKEKRVDGVFIVGLPYSEALIGNLKQTGLPFVMVGVGSFEREADSVYADPGYGTEMAVRELLETGHRKICLLNCSSRLRSHEWRLQGCLKAMADYNVELPLGWNLEPEHHNGRYAREVFRQFWEQGNRPDAIVAANGPCAVGVLSYLYEQGVRVPQELSLIAYEDSSICGYAIPALTSVNIRKEDMGYQAALCMLDKLKNPAKDVSIRTLTPYLVRRESVKNRSLHTPHNDRGGD